MFGNRAFSPYTAYGLGAAAKSGINWSSLLSNTQKTLGIINQAIPAFYQVKPIFNNMRTMFKVVNEFNKDDTNPINNVNTNTNNNINNNYQTNNLNTNNIVNDNQQYYSDDGPQFFL